MLSSFLSFKNMLNSCFSSTPPRPGCNRPANLYSTLTCTVPWRRAVCLERTSCRIPKVGGPQTLLNTGVVHIYGHSRWATTQPANSFLLSSCPLLISPSSHFLPSPAQTCPPFRNSTSCKHKEFPKEHGTIHSRMFHVTERLRSGSEDELQNVP